MGSVSIMEGAIVDSVVGFLQVAKYYHNCAVRDLVSAQNACTRWTARTLFVQILQV